MGCSSPGTWLRRLASEGVKAGGGGNSSPFSCLRRCADEWNSDPVLTIVIESLQGRIDFRQRNVFQRLDRSLALFLAQGALRAIVAQFGKHLSTARAEDIALPASHPLYQRLGLSCVERQTKYRELFSSTLPETGVHAIQTAARCSMVLGNDRFKGEVGRALGTSIGQATRGRPSKAGKPRAHSDEN